MGWRAKKTAPFSRKPSVSVSVNKVYSGLVKTKFECIYGIHLNLWITPDMPPVIQFLCLCAVLRSIMQGSDYFGFLKKRSFIKILARNVNLT